MSPEEIDSLNIYEATMLCMYRAVKELKVKPETVIVDAMPLHFSIPTISLIHGDAISASVAAASIVAKVYRDSLMDEYDARYPGYGSSKIRDMAQPIIFQQSISLALLRFIERALNP